MLSISQPVAISPLAAQAVIDEFAKSERLVFEAEKARASAGRSLRETENTTRGYDFDAERDLAIIPVKGTIIPRRPPCMRQYPELFNVCAMDELQGAIKAACANANVKAILLDVDSPGGQVCGVPETATLIRATQETRCPVLAFTSGMMCSAAYWLAAQSSAVFSTLSATVGSIGVYMAFLDSSRKMENDGYKIELFSTGKYKGAGVTGSLTDAQKAYFQGHVETIFGYFAQALNLRSPSPELMQGQSFTGAQAAENFLVDGCVPNLEAAFDSFRTTLAKMREKGAGRGNFHQQSNPRKNK